MRFGSRLLLVSIWRNVLSLGVYNCNNQKPSITIFSLPTITDKNLSNNSENQKKLRWSVNFDISFSIISGHLYQPEFSFCRGDWAVCSTSTHFWDFSKPQKYFHKNISKRTQVLSLKPFGDSRGNSYTILLYQLPSTILLVAN